MFKRFIITLVLFHYSVSITNAQYNDTLDAFVSIINNNGTLPNKLSDVGVFSDLTTLTPEAKIFPYVLNQRFWSDFAKKKRWFALTVTGTKFTFNEYDPWGFPAGAVLIKHFELETTRNDPATARRLETRFIVFKTGGAIKAVTYRWNEDESEAFLLSASGLDEAIQITEVNQTVRTQTWHYPSEFQCNYCHNDAAGNILGFNTWQLNRQFEYTSGSENQIKKLTDDGLLTGAENISPESLISIAALDDESVSLSFRVKSLLWANCSSCHREGGPGGGFWKAQPGFSWDQMKVINGTVNNTAFTATSKVINPNKLDESEIYQRLLNLGFGHMPPVATSEVNQEAVDIVKRFIESVVAEDESFEHYTESHFSNPSAVEAESDSDPDGDGLSNYKEFLLKSNPLLSGGELELQYFEVNQNLNLSFNSIPGRRIELEFKNDFSESDSWQLLGVPGSVSSYPASSESVEILDINILNNDHRYYRLKIDTP